MKKNTITDEDALVIKYQPLVISCVNKFNQWLSHEDFLDFIQVANIALLRAIRNFNPERGYKFATLARRCIKNQLINHTRRKTPRVYTNIELNYIEKKERVGNGLEELLPKGLSPLELETVKLLYENTPKVHIQRKHGFTKWQMKQHLRSIKEKLEAANE